MGRSRRRAHRFGARRLALARLGCRPFLTLPGGLVRHSGRSCTELSIGIAGMIGDLCESLIKRDLGKKDAAA